MLVWKPFGEHPFGKPRRWENNVKIDLREIWWNQMELV
jgi:hypothetical protein